MATTKKGVISASEWEQGTSPSSDSDKKAAVLAALQKMGKGGVSVFGLEELTHLKWLYGVVKALFEESKIERKKVGRGYYYRALQPAEEEQAAAQPAAKSTKK